MNCGYEDDRGLLETRMLADHRRQLEAVELRHADIHQDDGDIVLQQLLQRLARRRGFDQIFAETRQNDLVAQELCRLIVDQQDVDLVIRRRRFFSPPDRCCRLLHAWLHHRCSHMRNAESSCSVLTGFAR